MKHLKKISIVIVFAVFIGSLSITGLFAAKDVNIEVVSDIGSSIILNFKFGDYQSESVIINGQEYTQIWIPGEPLLEEKGAPALPHVNRSIIIPDDAKMSVRVLSFNYEDKIAKIVPSKGVLLRTIDPDQVPYEFGDIYGTDAFYPGPIASLGEPYILRDYRGIVVQVNPFQYNPSTGLLRICKEITFEVSAVGTGERNVLIRGDRVRASIKAFQTIYRSQFLNYDNDASSVDTGSELTGSTLYDPLDEEGEMLIIAHDPWIDNLDEFVGHKSNMGIIANVVGVSTIGNDATSIKSYIQDVYDTSDLAYVLLVGDAAQVATPMASGGASDPSYSKLAGADDYPEIMVGRFSAQVLVDLETQLRKTIDYETLPANEQEWFWKGTGIASSQGAGQGDEGQADYVHMGEIRGWLLADDYTHVDEIYDPGAADYMVSNAVNEGRGIINYCGHGSSTSWGTTGFNNADVDALVNDNMLPFIHSVACVNGQFNALDKCFAEAWLRATNGQTGEPTGAVVMYASSVNQSWAPPMEGQDEFNLLLTDLSEPYFSYGAMCFAGSCSMMDQYGGSGVEMFNTWIIFGDPSLRIIGYVPPPGTGLSVSPDYGLTASGTAGGPFSKESMQFTLRNNDNWPMDYEVTKSAPWITLTNPAGTIEAYKTVKVTAMLNEPSKNLDNGKYLDTLYITNLTNHDGDTTRSVVLTIGTMMGLGQWMLDTDPGWACEGEWAFGRPMGSGGTKDMNPDPGSAATGGNVYGANLDGNISKQVGGPYHMTTGAMDFTGYVNVTLSFQKWLNTYGPPRVSSMVEASNDGSNWSNLWSCGEMMTDDIWSQVTLDLSSVADEESSVYLRWGYQVNQKIPRTGSGWNIDDITVEAIPETARITLFVEKDRLYWNSITEANSYDVVRGDVDILHSSGGDFTTATDACLGNNLGTTELGYSETPDPGKGYWFLVRGVNASGSLSYQSLAGSQIGLRDEEINTAAVSCL
jgi:hypothetical protein